MCIETVPLFTITKLRRSGIIKISERPNTGTDSANRQRTCRSYGAWAFFRCGEL